MTNAVFAYLNANLDRVVQTNPEILEDMWIVNPSRTRDLEIMRDRVPESWAEKIEPRDKILNRAIELNASNKVLLILLYRGAKADANHILMFLSRGVASIARDEVYYTALNTAGISERDLLEQAQATSSIARRRLRIIKDLFYSVDAWEHPPSANDATLLSPLSEIAPSYLIEFTERGPQGDITYFLHVLEIQQEANIRGIDNVRNPWTRTVLPVNTVMEALNKITMMERRGFPLIQFSIQEAKDRTYGIMIPTQAMRIAGVVTRNAIDARYNTEVGIVSGLNPELFLAAKNKMAFIPHLEVPIDFGRINLANIMTNYTPALEGTARRLGFRS